MLTAKLLGVALSVAMSLDLPALAQDEPDSRLEADASLTLPKFGAAGSRHLGVVGSVGFALEDDDDSTDFNLAFAYHHFIIEDVEIIGEIGGWYFDQDDGDDAVGINPAFTIRWHFLNRDAWTLYADAGIGLLFATDDVPPGGTEFNFMPRAGGGATFRLDDRGTRLLVGARWHHVSNARIRGEGRNPDRDGVAVYAGVMWSF